MVFALGGLVAILGPWNMHGLESSLLAVAAGFVWALSSIVVKIMRKKHDIDLLNLIAWQGLFGSIPLIIVARLHHHRARAVERDLHRRAAVQRHPGERPHLGALALHPPQRCPPAPPVSAAWPSRVVGVISAWIQLGEQPGVLEGIGMGLIVVALAMLTARELVASGPRSRSPGRSPGSST